MAQRVAEGTEIGGCPGGNVLAHVYLLSCVGRKRDRASRADQLYTSPWFLKARSLAEERSDRWYILSAEYGLLEPSRIVEPYERTLNTMPKAERVGWSERVLAGLLARTEPNDSITILAGARYREHVVPRLRSLGYSVEIPMEGMRIGEQLQWLSREIAK